MGKKFPTPKQKTLTPVTQKTMKWQDETVTKLIVWITNLEKTVERLHTELLITKMSTTHSQVRLMIYRNINDVNAS